jgi:hypothetical protein
VNKKVSAVKYDQYSLATKEWINIVQRKATDTRPAESLFAFKERFIAARDAAKQATISFIGKGDSFDAANTEDILKAKFANSLANTPENYEFTHNFRMNQELHYPKANFPTLESLMKEADKHVKESLPMKSYSPRKQMFGVTKGKSGEPHKKSEKYCKRCDSKSHNPSECFFSVGKTVVTMAKNGDSTSDIAKAVAELSVKKSSEQKSSPKKTKFITWSLHSGSAPVPEMAREIPRTDGWNDSIIGSRRSDGIRIT